MTQIWTRMKRMVGSTVESTQRFALKLITHNWLPGTSGTFWPTYSFFMQTPHKALSIIQDHPWPLSFSWGCYPDEIKAQQMPTKTTDFVPTICTHQRISNVLFPKYYFCLELSHWGTSYMPLLKTLCSELFNMVFLLVVSHIIDLCCLILSFYLGVH